MILSHMEDMTVSILVVYPCKIVKIPRIFQVLSGKTLEMK